MQFIFSNTKPVFLIFTLNNPQTLTMKKFTFTFLFIALAVSVMAQEDLYKTVAKETCECVTKRNIDVNKRSEVEMALGLCMLESIQTHKIDIQITDENAMGKFGEQVGLQMAPLCPELFKAFMADEAEEVETIELTGKIRSIESGEFLYVILKEDSGKEHKLLWLRYFSGSDDFKNDPKKLIGKNVTVTYQNLECYIPKSKEYYNNKEILDMKFQ